MPRCVQREKDTSLSCDSNPRCTRLGPLKDALLTEVQKKTNSFKGADAYLFQSDHSGRFPLHWAAVYAFPEVAEILIKEGEKKLTCCLKLKIVTV